MQDEDQDCADIALVAAGDLQAFERIVLRWQKRLVNLAFRFCRDRTMAEDMAQEVFLKIFRSLSTFRGESAFSTWVTAIAVNTYRSHLRAKGLPLASLGLERAFTADPDPLDQVERSRRDESVRATVLSLPERYREAIVLYYFEEKDLAESSRVLGVPEGTLKARLHRARELMKRRCASLGIWTPAESRSKHDAG